MARSIAPAADVTEGLTPDELRELLPDWTRSLQAARVADSTVALYSRHVRYLLDWLAANAGPGDDDEPLRIGKPVLERYFVDLLNRKTRRNGREGETVKPAYANAQYRSIQQFWAWLEAEEEIGDNPFRKMSPPNAPIQPVPVRPDDDVRAMLATCKGREFVQLRDTAIIRLFADTGVRVSGMAGMDLEDFNFDHDTVHIVLKGGSEHTIPFGAKTSDAVRRYRRARGKHPAAARHTAMWIGDKGPLTPSGIAQMLDRRAADAEIADFNPHLFRHLFAHTWLANGGSETDLMRLMGWKSRAMLTRYAVSAADERARSAHKKAALGDRF